MPGWERSTGHERTGTSEWQRTRKRILNRDGRICYVCGKPGADTVDHIVPVAQGGSEADSNLSSIHDKPCHRTKTTREGHAAMREIRQKAKHPVERHQGLL
jgi:5-methylcytosine-specific restriction protein A